MKRLLGLVLLFIVAFMVLTVVVFKLMGWSGLGLMLVLMVAGAMYLKTMAGKLMQKAFVTPFLMKGAVLKDARAEVHSVQPATRPARTFVQNYNIDSDDDPGEDEMEVEDEGSDEYSRHFSVDVTITPQTTDGAVQLWEPGELMLVKPDTASGNIDAEDVEIGTILDIEIWEDGAWTEEDGSKFPGAQRVKLLVGVQEGVRTCRFRYYFEVFGNLDLVEPMLS